MTSEYTSRPFGSRMPSFRNPPTADIRNPDMLQGPGMTIFPRSVLFQSYASNIPWLVAATQQAIRTGERPSNQGFRLDEKKGSLVPRCSGLAYRSD